MKYMLFTIVEEFGKSAGEAWAGYINWRGIPFERFDSLDGLLRPSLFEPTTDEDWDHVVKETYMQSYIRDFAYARQAHVNLGSGSLVGFTYSEHNEAAKGFLGYDIIDGYCDVSLLSNWGNDVEIVNSALAVNALVPSLAQAESILEYLLANHADDNHVEGCQIVSVYSTNHLTDDQQ